MSDKKYIIKFTIENEEQCTVLSDNEDQSFSTLLDSENNDFVSLLHEDDKIGKRSLNFLDSKKNKVKSWPVMIDLTQKGSLPLYTNKPCRYCHHSFSSHPIGCPVKYNSENLDKTDIKYKRSVDFFKRYNINNGSTDFFETEHLFCSWPCVKSYILNVLSSNPSSLKYMESLSYLTLMYKKVHGIKDKNVDIPAAPPIEVIESYGGHLTIDEYRKSFGIIDYNTTVNTRRPYMFSCSAYIEETKANI